MLCTYYTAARETKEEKKKQFNVPLEAPTKDILAAKKVYRWHALIHNNRRPWYNIGFNDRRAIIAPRGIASSSL